MIFVISDSRFHHLSERAVVAPILDHVPASPRPGHFVLGKDRTTAVNLLHTMRTERLLDRVDAVAGELLVRARRAAHAILG